MKKRRNEEQTKMKNKEKEKIKIITERKIKKKTKVTEEKTNETKVCFFENQHQQMTEPLFLPAQTLAILFPNDCIDFPLCLLT